MKYWSTDLKVKSNICPLYLHKINIEIVASHKNSCFSIISGVYLSVMEPPEEKPTIYTVFHNT